MGYGNDLDSFQKKEPQIVLIGPTAGFATPYLLGEWSLEDLRADFRAQFEAFLQQHIGLGITSGDDSAFNRALLESLYTRLTSTAMHEVLSASNRHGRRAYGEGGYYYSASFYYLAEELHAVLDGELAGLARELGLENTAPPEKIFPTYSSVWRHYFSRRALFDEEGAGPPPQDFEVFFRQVKFDSSRAGRDWEKLHITAGEGKAPAAATVSLPRGAGLFQPDSPYALPDAPVVHRADPATGIVRPCHDITALLGGCPGGSYTDHLHSFIAGHINNNAMGSIAMRCGEELWERDLPFHLSLPDSRSIPLAPCGEEAGDTHADESPGPGCTPARLFLSHFTFHSIHATMGATPASGEAPLHGRMDYFI